MQRALRYGTPLALAMLDLDHFKQINDTYGHDAGDLVLVRLAETLHQLMREVDVVARMGGEEFAVLMPDTQAEVAVQVADRLRQAVAEMAVETPAATLRCTASFGVSEFLPGDSRIQDVFVRADQALYRAKQAGRNRVERWRA
ncbi:MAG: GGDEF domain-containing protein [Thiobacillus sp.]|nr:GGDEF domain-containing protein [Thiobacillus sp.]